jgi:hypothetical protein
MEYTQARTRAGLIRYAIRLVHMLLIGGGSGAQAPELMESTVAGPPGCTLLHLRSLNSPSGHRTCYLARAWVPFPNGLLVGFVKRLTTYPRWLATILLCGPMSCISDAPNAERSGLLVHLCKSGRNRIVAANRDDDDGRCSLAVLNCGYGRSRLAPSNHQVVGSGAAVASEAEPQWTDPRESADHNRTILEGPSWACADALISAPRGKPCWCVTRPTPWTA